jgi:hypothetical protein
MTDGVVIALTALFIYGPTDPSPLPEIGRVRASPAACTVAREIVRPATDAVVAATDSYIAAFGPMRAFASDIADDSPKAFIDRELVRHRAYAVRKALLTISKALGDRRVSIEAANQDPQIARVRSSLQDLEGAIALEDRLLDHFLLVGLNDGSFGPTAKKRFQDRLVPSPRPPRPGFVLGGFIWVSTGISSVDADQMDRLNVEIFTVAEARILQGAPELRALARACEQPKAP